MHLNQRRLRSIHGAPQGAFVGLHVFRFWLARTQCLAFSCAFLLCRGPSFTRAASATPRLAPSVGWLSVFVPPSAQAGVAPLVGHCAQACVHARSACSDVSAHASAQESVGAIFGGDAEYCAAGPTYFGPCVSEPTSFAGMSDAAKARWSAMCQAVWPCVGARRQSASTNQRSLRQPAF